MQLAPNKKTRTWLIASLFSTAVPLHAFAASKLNDILTSITDTFNEVIGILFIIATIVFFWGIIRYLASAGDEKAKKDARNLITWGIVGLAVMASAWGIAEILDAYFLIPFGGIRLGY